MDPDVYRIRSTDEINGMLTAAGLQPIEYERGDQSNHSTHLFVARLADSPAPPTRDDRDQHSTMP
jgi:hypothetical protein